MTFNEWFDKTYPDTIGKYDAVTVSCRSSAAFGWDAARKQTAEKIIAYLNKDVEILNTSGALLESATAKKYIRELKQKYLEGE